MMTLLLQSFGSVLTILRLGSLISSFETMRRCETRCVPSHRTYQACRETCGACVDSFRDLTTKTVYVNRIWTNQDCMWLESGLHGKIHCVGQLIQ